MGRLQIKGQVLDSNGKKVSNALVEIFDRDSGSGIDRILRRVSNSSGEFSGLSTEWKDGNWLEVAGVRVPEPDILDLVFKVAKGGKKHEGPFIHIGDNLSAPIVLPFPDPAVKIATVNGTPCKDELELSTLLQKVLIDAPDEIVISIYDEKAKAMFAPLIGVTTRRSFVESAVPGINGVVPGTGVPEIFFVLLGVAVIITAAGAVVGVILICSAILYAIAQGYDAIDFKQEVEGSDSRVDVTIRKGTSHTRPVSPIASRLVTPG